MTESTIQRKPTRISTTAWILYDLANTAYSMNVVSLYFSTWIILTFQMSDIWVSLVNSLSMLFVAFTMPVLGDWSDIKQKKLKGLMLFSLICISGTALIGLLGLTLKSTAILLPLVLLIYIVTNYSYQGGLVFYNALMPAVSTPKNMGRVSGYGTAIGYMGTILGLMVARIFVEGDFFGLTLPGVQAGGPGAAFIPTAVLFLVFALPVFFLVDESLIPAPKQKEWKIKASYKKVINNIRDTQEHPGLLRFLISRLLYQDSVATIIIYMGVFTQVVMDFTLNEASLFMIILTPFAIIGSAICGILTDHYGPKKVLTVVIVFWVISLAVIIISSNRTLFWIMGAIIGILLGSVETSSRPLLITLAPREKMGEFFGIYALSGRLAAIIGPLVWSAVTFSFGAFGDVFKFKAAIGALAIIMILGLLVLLPVPDFHKKVKKLHIQS